MELSKTISLIETTADQTRGFSLSLLDKAVEKLSLSLNPGYDLSSSRQPTITPSQTTPRPLPTRILPKTPRKASGTPSQRPLVNKKQVLAERLKLREEQEFRQTCTFKPSINRSKAPRNQPVEERLMEIGRQQLQKRKVLADRARLSEVYSFQPYLPRSRSLNKLPIHLRKDEKIRAQVLADVRQQLDQELLFKPHLSEYSRRLAEKKRCCTLETEASDTTQALDTSKTKKYLNVSEFLERQRLQECKRSFELQKKSIELKQLPSFHPSISENSLKLAGKRPPSSELFNRLSEDRRNKTLQLSDLQHEYYSQFPHRPILNSVSQAIGKASSLTALVNEKRSLRYVNSEENELRMFCSFEPQINPTTNKSQYAKPEFIISNIQNEQIKKDLALAELSKSLQTERLKECTFSPKITETISKVPSAPIPGLEKYLFLRDLARSKEVQLETRKKEVFGLKNSGVWCHALTTAKPFNLTPSSKASRVAKLAEELNAERGARCTFSPVTNER